MAWSTARVGGLLATAGLLGLVYAASWRAMTVPGIGPIGITGAPEGQAVTITLYEVGRLVPPDRYWIRRGELGFEVVGPTAGLAIGQELTVHGVVENGVLIEQWRDPAPMRAGKKGLGFLGLAIAGLLLLVTVRGTPAGLVPRG